MNSVEVGGKRKVDEEPATLTAAMNSWTTIVATQQGQIGQLLERVNQLEQELVNYRTTGSAKEMAAKRARKTVSSTDLMFVQTQMMQLKQQVESLTKRLDASEAKEATAGPAMPPKPKPKNDWQLMTFTEKIQDTARWIGLIQELVKDDELFRILFCKKGFDVFLKFAATEGTVQEEKMEPETEKQVLSKILHLRGCFKLFLANKDDMMKEIEDCRQKKLNPEEFHAKMKEKMSTLISDAYKSQSGQGCKPGAGGMVGPAATTNTQK